ncbi:precorrin-6Y C5,15-methyltransferase (decarboxylating) [Austwickia chelonae]|uniref:Putative precorrin-6Y C5,15-methyltransferase n=1 Tax=Austwickia chelonae NBRC 105200 TaxID=1184607 RepID=K6V4L8_9MICO|nr:precorrin-6y C5,15-methyltransferase (decarboxylating) subunit CbiE [Austwickia chelonae]GAB77083.1 putative precorrin-6Y C5,15-methyltransferase [Austwickia chelonae NBRC 105200]SEW33862.1 precorrin-6Y C5,15-methyltransferase (decarboxylating) [Austwickia chelonae]
MIEVYGYLGTPPEDVRRACAEAALVVAGARALDGLGVPEERRVVLGRVMPAIEKLLAHEADPDAGPAVVLASGDPLFYGVVRRFRAAGLHCRVHPAASSIAHAFAAVGLPWDDAQVVSAHGHGIGPALAACRALPKVALLTAPGHGICEISAGLADLPRWYVLAERLGETDEHVRILDGDAARALTAADVAQPNVLLVLDSPPDTTAALGKPTAYVGGPRPASTALDGHPERAGTTVMPTAATPRDGIALIWGRHLPVLGETVWCSTGLLDQIRPLAARTGAAVLELPAGKDTPPEPAVGNADLVVTDDPRHLALLTGRPPRRLALLADEHTAQACAHALDDAELPGEPTVEHLTVTGETGQTRHDYLITLDLEQEQQ